MTTQANIIATAQAEANKHLGVHDKRADCTQSCIHARTYLYRRGDGNEGNFIRSLITLTNENPYAALRALVVNDYIAGRSVRRHIIRTIEIDGEADYRIHATVFEGPKGQTAFGAAYITAELQPLTQEDADHYRDQNVTEWKGLKSALDRGAWKLYREHATRD